LRHLHLQPEAPLRPLDLHHPLTGLDLPFSAPETRLVFVETFFVNVEASSKPWDFVIETDYKVDFKAVDVRLNLSPLSIGGLSLSCRKLVADCTFQCRVRLYDFNWRMFFLNLHLSYVHLDSASKRRNSLGCCMQPLRSSSATWRSIWTFHLSTEVSLCLFHQDLVLARNMLASYSIPYRGA